LIDDAVRQNGTDVTFYLMFPGAYQPFLQILTQTWAAVESKQWIVNQVIKGATRPDWDGNWTKAEVDEQNNYGFLTDHSAWVDFNQPLISPLDDPTPMEYGSGPFQLTALDYPAKFWAMRRFEGYWRGWPAHDPVLAGTSPAGWINTIEETWAFTWGARKTLFLNGDCDFCALPSLQYLSDIYKQSVPPALAYDPPNYPYDGIRCVHPLITLSVDAIFYTMDINPATFWGPIGPAGVFDPSNIPRDFFGNETWGVHVRKAFSYAFDYARFLSSVVNNEGFIPATAIIPGLAYYDASVTGYYYSVAKAVSEFDQVPGLGAKGFTLNLVYNTGNLEREQACIILKDGLTAAWAAGHYTGAITINLVGVEWSPYLTAAVQHKVPCYIIGWLVDFPDPHDFAFPFYHTGGSFSAWQVYSNSTMDAVIDKGIKDTTPADRSADYHLVETYAIQDCPSVMIVQPYGRHFERDWVVGYYFNPAYPGGYFYNRWKWYYLPENTLNTAVQPYSYNLPTDVNYDGKTDMKDIGVAAKAFGQVANPIGSKWCYRADVNNDRKIDMKDIGFIAKWFGKPAPPGYGTWSPGFSAAIDPVTSVYDMSAETPINFTTTTAYGTGPYTYVWYTDMNTTVLHVVATDGPTASTTDSILLAPNDTTENPYLVYCEVTETHAPPNVATTQKAYVFTTFEVTIYSDPEVNGINPKTGGDAVVMVPPYGTVYFNSTHSGATEPVAYQWYENDAPITGATDWNYTAAAPASTEDDFFYLNITDANNCWTASDPIEVYYQFIVAISPAPTATFSASGTGHLLFTSTVTGPFAPVTYSWRVYEPSDHVYPWHPWSPTVATTSTFDFKVTDPYYAEGPGAYQVRLRVEDSHGIRVTGAKTTLTVTA